MGKVRVLVVDDSAFMRKIISELLTDDDRIAVVATARNGEDGLRKIEQYKPDVVTLDIEMPVMDGITTLEQIMEQFPTPVVMVSSMTEADAEMTLGAMKVGAVDFIEKPSGAISLDMHRVKEDMIQTILHTAKANVKNEVLAVEHAPKKSKIRRQPFTHSIIAIGTSTGGPRALQSILTALPETFSTPIVIVQHMPPRFTKSLANRLHALCGIDVKEAVHGELLQKGVAYIAPGDEHMRIRQVGTSLAIELRKDPPKQGHRPAVDVLFSSLASLKRINKVAIILTGMGRDGSQGIIKIKEKDEDAVIIAESKETAIVDGMPSSAIQTNHVTEIVPLHQIAETMIDCTRKT